MTKAKAFFLAVSEHFYSWMFAVQPFLQEAPQDLCNLSEVSGVSQFMRTILKKTKS